jgi:hypothetical protein
VFESKSRTVDKLDAEIKQINNETKSFSVPSEIVRIAKKF